MKEDPGLYDYWPYHERPKIQWPNGARLAFRVAPNIEFYELNPPPNPQRKAWPQPYPALPGYSIRDYGNRVGHMWQTQLLGKYAIRGSISLSVALCDHHPDIIALCKERDWEFFSHGIYNTRYIYDLSEEQERQMIMDSVASIEQQCSKKLAGYLAPACHTPSKPSTCSPRPVAFIPATCSMTTSPHPCTCAAARNLSPSPTRWR